MKLCSQKRTGRPSATTAEGKPHMTRKLFLSVPKMRSSLLEVKRGHLDCR